MSLEYQIENVDVEKKIAEWLAWDQNAVTRSEIESLFKEKKFNELKKRLLSRMEFGTAGLRSSMGAGYSMMNDLTIIQTTQGFSVYMLELSPTVRKRGVIIGFDARHNSKRFAELTASILLHQKIPVYLFSEIVPTPFVAYGVRRMNCEWGIMITASHNPKEDNGYKVYYCNGAQIISPHDKCISLKIEENLEPWSTSWCTSVIENSPDCKDPYHEIYASYMEDLRKLSFQQYMSEPTLNATTQLRFTYTPMHGVGYKFFTDAMKTFGFQSCIPVLEQIEPDPEFSTVKYPNPEEGKSALDLAIKTANESNSTIILANDPDADRLALAEKQPDGQWHVFDGNEIGSIIGWWLLTCFKVLHPDTVSDAYCLASTVSSRLLQAIAVKEGANYVETLTGFKYMGNKSCDLLAQGKKVLFAFEEAIGFMCGTNVLDKDGISAGVVVAEMAAYLNSKCILILEQLESIQNKYGYHVSINSYFICHDAIIIKQIFERLRNYGTPGQYPATCGPYSIKYVRDLTTGYDNSQPDGKAILPTSKSSQMITFTFQNGCIITMRTSGTEPKIKYYTEFCSKPDSGFNKEAVKRELQKIVQCLIQYFFEPEKNGLIYREA